MIGNGTSSNPYIITTVADFQVVRDNLTAYFKLGNDIDFNGADFIGIGVSSSNLRFACHFDGDGYTIKNVNVVRNTTTNSHGFFGYVQDGTVKNVKFTNITANLNITVNESVGLLASLFQGKMENVHVKGTLNQTGSVARVGGLIGIAYETNNRLEFHNVFSEVEMNFTNVTPQSSSIRQIGGVFGFVTNDTTSPSPYVSNVVVNNKLSISNPGDFFIGRFVGNRNQIAVPYVNTYVNISHFNNNYTEPFKIVTDATIKNPLTLDTDYWVQPIGEISKLISFYVPPSGKHGNESADVPYLISNVSYNVSKRVNKVIDPVVFKMAHVDSCKRLSTSTNVISTEYLVTVRTTNAQTKSYSIDVPIGMFDVDSYILKSVVRNLSIDYNLHNVTVDVFYPIDDTLPIYAYTYVMENGSFIYNKENTTNCEVI